LEAATRNGSEEIVEGELACTSCGARFPVVRGIPRFVDRANYARSFGLQWNRFKRTQLDKFSGLDFSRRRFFETTAWPEDMGGQLILDAGCGAGRFTEIALQSGAEVVAFDLSDAVEANNENNGCTRLHIVQADIVQPPFRSARFDPAKSFAALVPLMKPGAQLAIDAYASNTSRKMNFEERVSASLRRYTVRMEPEELMRWTVRWVSLLLPIKRFLRHCLPLGRRINQIIPIRYSWKRGTHLPYRQILEWSILETYDRYAPQIDQPQSLEQVQAWFARADLTGLTVKLGPNGINGRASKVA
jgi:SAM-dependent methyltransferase